MYTVHTAPHRTGIVRTAAQILLCRQKIDKYMYKHERTWILLFAPFAWCLRTPERGQTVKGDKEKENRNRTMASQIIAIDK